MIVKLFTRDGRIVDRVELAPYQILPEIVAYGQRVFVLKEGTKDYYEGIVAVPLATKVIDQ